jgi:hypothetical protein
MTIEALPTPLRYEALSPLALIGIRAAFSGIQSAVLRISDVDPSKGCVVLSATERCVWTHDSCRITFWADSVDGYGGGISKAVDPLSDPANRA